MATTDLVRLTHCYYDTCNTPWSETYFARADIISREAYEIIALHVGTLAITEPVGLNLQGATEHLDIHQLKLPAHAIILTERGLLDPEGRRVQGTATYTTEFGLQAAQSRVAVSMTTPYGRFIGESAAVLAVAHELTHTFGIASHCDDQSCIMHEDALNLLLQEKRRVRRRFFCDDHVRQLESWQSQQ